MKRIGWVLLFLAFCIAPSPTNASIIVEKTDFIIWMGGKVYPFIVEEAPVTCKVTLTDFSVAPLDLKFLYVAITTSTSLINYMYLTADDTQKTLFFDAKSSSKTYFANVFGIGGGPCKSGNFGLLVESVPIPTSLLLLGSGLAGIVGIRKFLTK